jgi:transposase InsO family protein
MIDAFSRWVKLFPSKTSGTSEAAGSIFQHFGRFGTPDVIHTDQGPAFRKELFSELSRLSQVKHSFATAYSKEENGLVERANQEVMLFDARMHDKWSYEQLPMVQRIMNTSRVPVVM